MNKLAYIQQWRGVAILLVLLAHSAHHNISKTLDNQYLDKFVWFGGHGVTLFFVLSAFTLCLVQDNSSQNFNPKSFFIKRFFRIAPLIYLGLIAYSFIINKSLGFNIDLVLNLVFLSWLKPSAIYNGVPGGWSITTEFTFYYLFPIIYSVIVKKHNAVRWLLVSILASRVLIMVYARVYPNLSASMYELNPLVQFPVFFIGILLYQKIASKDIKIQRFDLVLTAIIIILHFLFIGFVIRDFVIYATMFALLIFSNSSYKFNIRPLNQVVSFIGELSFTIYITHFAVNQFLIIKIFSFDDGSVFGLISRFSTLLLVSIVLSIPIYYLIEKPLINLGKSLASPKVKKPITNFNLGNHE